MMKKRVKDRLNIKPSFKILIIKLQNDFYRYKKKKKNSFLE